MNLYDELLALAAALDAAGLPYALCGGLAVAEAAAGRPIDLADIEKLSGDDR